jgi:hypothetical protein
VHGVARRRRTAVPIPLVLRSEMTAKVEAGGSSKEEVVVLGRVCDLLVSRARAHEGRKVGALLRKYERTRDFI